MLDLGCRRISQLGMVECKSSAWPVQAAESSRLVKQIDERLSGGFP
jgi:hypothetical protein